MTAIWNVGGHWYVGSPTHHATALEVTIGDANEFTIGDYNFFCAGFYLDATVGPLVEVIMPFPYSVFGGTLVEIIIPQTKLLLTAVAAGVAAAAAGVGAAAMGEDGQGVGGAAGAAAAAVALTAANMGSLPEWMNGCQADLVYGNYFFTVYGSTYETVEDKHHHHNGPVHWHLCAQQLQSVAGASVATVKSVLVVAATGMTVSAVGALVCEANQVTLFGSAGLTVGATASLGLAGSEWLLVGAGTMALVATGAMIKIGSGSMSLNAPMIYLNNEVQFIREAPGTDPPPPVAVPAAALTDALAALTAAVAAVAAAGPAHGAPAGPGGAHPPSHP
jgi:hypothetical protein